ncbi:MAG TPA: LPS assembly protein LptD [Bryobacteraceae bacterium]|nr:LPS assembly protein LptD [Bryobacteraceae bacterium]
MKSIPAGEWNIHRTCPPDKDPSQCWIKTEGKVTTIHAFPAEIEDSQLLFRADDITYDDETKKIVAAGSVYYHNYEKSEEIWCDKLEYYASRGDEHGTFDGHLIGETKPRIVTRPGILTSKAPFHFEGEWAERNGDRYIVHNGWITNCDMPKPWWRLRGVKFDIIPEERAIAHDSTFLLHDIPVFFFPWFYHPLNREPRKSGFLLPEPGHSSLRGWTIGLGYFWAINRSYDLTYQAEGFTAGAETNHFDFRGKPKEGTDFDVLVFSAWDSGTPNTGTPLQKYSGATVYAVGKSDLGDGWTMHGVVNYTSSFRFRLGWSQSYSEANQSEYHSTGFLDKNWSTYTFDAVLSRLENFQTQEIPVIDPITNQRTGYLNDAVIIRKLPEFEFSSRDHSFWNRLPLWYSFESSAGLLFRSEPFFDSNNNLTDRFETSPFTDRIRFAPHVTTAFHLGSLHIIPSAGIEETFYSESQAPYLDHYHAIGTDLVRSARDFSLDLIFPTLERVFNKKTFLGDKLKHVIEPRARYQYVTGVGEDFNRFIRFDENDLLVNTNEVEISLTNRLIAKHGDSDQDVLTWELFQKRYFDPTFGGALISGQRNVFESTADVTAYAFLVGPRGTSPVVSLLRTTPVKGLGFQWQADYDARLHAIVDSTLSVDYRWKWFFVSGGNSEVHNNAILTPYENQFNARAGYGQTNHRGLNAAVDVGYDYRQRVVQYTTTQVTYNTDCCGLTVQYRRIRRIGFPDDVQYAASFSVANIGSYGNLKKTDRWF